MFIFVHLCFSRTLIVSRNLPVISERHSHFYIPGLVSGEITLWTENVLLPPLGQLFPSSSQSLWALHSFGLSSFFIYQALELRTPFGSSQTWSTEVLCSGKKALNVSKQNPSSSCRREKWVGYVSGVSCDDETQAIWKCAQPLLVHSFPKGTWSHRFFSTE